MGFLDKLTNTISSTGKGVEQKAKKVSGTVKLNSQIKELSECIQEYMRQVRVNYIIKNRKVSRMIQIYRNCLKRSETVRQRLLRQKNRLIR